MALILADRVKSNTTSTGIGTVVIGTAALGYQGFDVIGNANTTYYTIAGQSTNEWEVGIGTFYTGNSSLTRDVVLASSNSNAAVIFSAGIKDVFVTYPAEKSVNLDAANLVTITNLLSGNVVLTGGQINGVAHTGGSIDNMTIGAGTANSGVFTTLAATTLSATTLANTALNNTNTITVKDTAFTIEDQTDSTKKAVFELSGLTPNNTVVYTLPQGSANASTLVDNITTQDVGGTKTFTGAIQNLGSSAGNTTVNIAYGATPATDTKNINIGTGGLANSVTNVYIGSAVPGAFGNTVINSELVTIGANAALGGATNPILATTGDANNYIQNYIINYGNGAYSSSDFVAYPLNGTDVAGWIDMGITGPAYNQDIYSVTGGNEGYVFMSAPDNTTSGNLVFATDSTGLYNAMQFYTGGFNQTKANVSMTLSNAGALTVKGTIKANSVGFTFPDGTVQSTAASGAIATGNNSIVINNVNITSNATIGAGQNGFSVGPVNTANGVTVTIAANSTWVVL